MALSAMVDCALLAWCLLMSDPGATLRFKYKNDAQAFVHASCAFRGIKKDWRLGSFLLHASRKYEARWPGDMMTVTSLFREGKGNHSTFEAADIRLNESALIAIGLAAEEFQKNLPSYRTGDLYVVIESPGKIEDRYLELKQDVVRAREHTTGASAPHIHVMFRNQMDLPNNQLPMFVNEVEYSLCREEEKEAETH